MLVSQTLISPTFSLGDDRLTIVCPMLSLQVFGDIMIDYSYVELTSACLTALDKFRRRFPTHLPSQIARSIKRGASFIRAIQRPDG